MKKSELRNIIKEELKTVITEEQNKEVLLFNKIGTDIDKITGMLQPKDIAHDWKSQTVARLSYNILKQKMHNLQNKWVEFDKKLNTI